MVFVDYEDLGDRLVNLDVNFALLREMQRRINEFSKMNKMFAEYRFGLNGERIHSRLKTAEHFALSRQEVVLLETAILFYLKIGPRPRGCTCCRRRSLKDYLD